MNAHFHLSQFLINAPLEAQNLWKISINETFLLIFKHCGWIFPTSIIHSLPFSTGEFPFPGDSEA